MDVVLIFFGVIIIGGLVFVAFYNSLVRLKNHCEEAWSDIQVQMKRRYNLIPNLVKTVKGYAKHESETLERVVAERSRAMEGGGGDLAQQAQGENMLSSTLKSIFALAENYPDLKANTNFQELQRELTDAEDKIMAARRFYNSNVKYFNVKIEQFPSNLVALIFNFTKREFFELAEDEAAARQPVDVKF